MTLYAVVCHFVLLNHRGALWRDEVQIVNIALSPTFSDFWRDLAIDTFPALWPATVKGWTAFYDSSDGSLRVLGLMVGLATLAAIWWAAWQVGRGFPVLALALFALCPTVICFGDTVRGYGLGLFLLLLMYAQVWKAASEPTARHLVLGLVAAVLAAQAMYFNAVILLALGGASTVIALLRRTWKPVLVTGGIGLLAAVSLLPYADPLTRQSQWRGILHTAVTLSLVLRALSAATNSAGAFAVWVWLGVTLLALAAAIQAAASAVGERRKEEGAGSRKPAAVLPANSSLPPAYYDAGIFAGATVVAGIAAFAGFIFFVSQTTNVWYYMPLMAVLAASFDAVFEASALAGQIGRVARLCLAAVLLALTAPAAWSNCHIRMTNVDLIAQHLEKRAGKDDLIVLAPWYRGVTFSRYYHGAGALDGASRSWRVAGATLRSLQAADGRGGADSAGA